MELHKMIKVAMVSESMNIGGGEMIAAQLASYIDSDRFDVKFFVIANEQENRIKEYLIKHGVCYECLNLPTSFDFSSYKVFTNALNKFRPDIVHEHLDVTYSWIWTLLHKVPLVATIHSDPFRRKNMKVDMLIRLHELFGTQKIVGCSKKTEELSLKCYGLRKECVTHIYNPIDISLYEKSKQVSDQVHFVHVGRFHEVKNQSLLVKAMASLIKSGVDCDLTFAGDGPLFDNIRKQVLELGLTEKIIFLGNVSDISGLLSKMSVFVLPSKTEAFPVVLLEAMATGLPIIASDVGGISEMITDNGILIRPNDLISLIDAMRTLAEKKEIRNQMSELSLRNVKRFNKDVIARQYETVYTELVKKEEQ